MLISDHSIKCPLCDAFSARKLDFNFKSRLFYNCTSCQLIYANPESFPDYETAKNRYLNHKNDPNDDGYVSFLSQIIDPLASFLHLGAKGLDFGCGPNPVLSEVMTQKGFLCDHYDPIFFPKPLIESYDYVVATECFEHFFNPKEDIQKITSILKTDGLLAVMTNTWDENIALQSWYYVRDWTHVSFYHENTFHWICKTYGYSLVFKYGRNIFILQKE